MRHIIVSLKLFLTFGTICLIESKNSLTHFMRAHDRRLRSHIDS